MEQDKWNSYYTLVKLGLKNKPASFNELAKWNFSEAEIKEIEEFEDRRMDEKNKYKAIERTVKHEASIKEKELIEEITKENPEWVKERKLLYLTDEINRIEDNIKEIYERKAMWVINSVFPEWFIRCLIKLWGLDQLEKELKCAKARFRINKHYLLDDNNDNEITPEIIARAREYPIDKIIEVKRNKALCLWHPDKNPSMHYYKKTNTVYCFTCNTFGDAIDIFMKKNNVGFVQAVIFLGR